MRQLFLGFILLALSISSSAINRSSLWIGGGVSLYLPSNTLNSNNYIGFNDVANSGFGLKANFDWQFQPTLILGGEIGFLRSSIDQNYWNMDKYGSIDGSFLTVPFLLNAKILLDRGDIRPYVAMLFGGNIIHNTLDFVTSHPDNVEYPSYSYSTTNFKPSVAPEIGVDIMLSKKALITISGRYTYIANLESTVIPVLDQNGYAISSNVANAHGHQNYFEITVGLRFATK